MLFEFSFITEGAAEEAFKFPLLSSKHKVTQTHTTCLDFQFQNVFDNFKLNKAKYNHCFLHFFVLFTFSELPSFHSNLNYPILNLFKPAQ